MQKPYTFQSLFYFSPSQPCLCSLTHSSKSGLSIEQPWQFTSEHPARLTGIRFYAREEEACCVFLFTFFCCPLLASQPANRSSCVTVLRYRIDFAAYEALLLLLLPRQLCVRTEQADPDLGETWEKMLVRMPAWSSVYEELSTGARLCFARGLPSSTLWRALCLSDPNSGDCLFKVKPYSYKASCIGPVPIAESTRMHWFVQAQVRSNRVRPGTWLKLV